MNNATKVVRKSAVELRYIGPEGIYLRRFFTEPEKAQKVLESFQRKRPTNLTDFYKRDR